MTKLPYFPFYPGDWQKDAALRRCSHGARGVWIDILCLMFDCEQRGVLATGGTPITDEELCFVIGGDFARTKAHIAELFDKGVMKKNDAGAYFSARIMRDDEIRKVRAASGLKGGKRSGKTRRSKARSKIEANGEAKGKQIPENEYGYIDSSIPVSMRTDEFISTLREFIDHRKELKKPLKKTGLSKLVRQLEKVGAAHAVAALNASIANGWQGVFPDKVSVPVAAASASRLPTAEDDANWTPY